MALVEILSSCVPKSKEESVMMFNHAAAETI
jgi:hypothetical protein